MEKFETIQRSSIELSANYEGNDALCFYDRLHDPVIKQQMVDLFYRYYESQDPLPTEYFDENNVLQIKYEKTKLPSREQIGQELSEKIEKVFSVTGIDLDPKGSSYDGDMLINDENIRAGMIASFSQNPTSGERWTVKQLSIVEAHEKGHGIRNFVKPGWSFEHYLLSGFDFSEVAVDDDLRKLWHESDPSGKAVSDKEILEGITAYFSKPMELIERMAQLKNYFGMNGNQIFTKKHLDYAKIHYMNDTGMGIQMKPFLDAITPNTEEVFLELINSLGI
jgi:hypothetical protein